MAANLMANPENAGQAADGDAFYERRYQTLMATVPLSILFIDRRLSVVAASQNFFEKSRNSAVRALGRRLGEILPAAIVEQMQLEKRVRQVLETGQPVKGERLTYRAPGIPLRIYFYSLLPVPWDERLEEVMLVMEDITEQIHAWKEIERVERHLASIVESASDIIVSTDGRGRILTWNNAAERTTGLHFEEVRRRDFAGLHAAEEQGTVRAAFAALAGRPAPLQAEWTLLTKDNHPMPVAWVLSTMPDETGEIGGIVAVGRDLTERRKLEAQILQSQKLAALGVMAGGIAHEIRNPLAVCSSAAQFLLEDDPSPEFLRECAQKIQAGVERASTIIENLLRFARIEPQQALEPVDMVAVVHNTFAIVANEARLHQISLSEHHDQPSVWVNGNMRLLEQMLMNLTLNAFKAMPDGGKLTVALSAGEEQMEMVVHDTGCGIGKDELGRVFDPFYTTRPAGEGTGLGLSLCYAIVRQHNGTMAVDSAKGRGTSFHVCLPLLPNTPGETG